VNLDPNAFVAVPDLIQALDEHAVPLTCAEERLLFRQGDSPEGLYILKHGAASLQMTAPDGHSLISMQAAPGSLLGLPGVIGNKPYTLTAIAAPGARLGYISRADFTTLMQTHPLLSLKILQVLAAEVSSARRALVEM
jgi:CRP-like cAMP-binding protein